MSCLNFKNMQQYILLYIKTNVLRCRNKKKVLRKYFNTILHLYSMTKTKHHLKKSLSPKDIVRCKSESEQKVAIIFILCFIYDHYYTMFSRVEWLSNEKRETNQALYTFFHHEFNFKRKQKWRKLYQIIATLAMILK